MNKIRTGDQVIVLTGRDKGKRGTVSARTDVDHVVVDGINVVKKHVKPNPMAEASGILETKGQTGPDRSKLMLRLDSGLTFEVTNTSLESDPTLAGKIGTRVRALVSSITPGFGIALLVLSDPASA